MFSLRRDFQAQIDHEYRQPATDAGMPSANSTICLLTVDPMAEHGFVRIRAWLRSHSHMEQSVV